MKTKLPRFSALLLAALLLCGCGETTAPAPTPTPHVHSWSPANCVRPAVCTFCGEEQGVALGHSWVAATADQPRRCSVCGETDTEGYPTPSPAPTPTPAPTPATVLSSDGAVELFTYDESLTQVYSVSVAHSPSLSRCESCVRKLRKVGYNAYLFEIPGKAGYTIQIGVFSSLEDADDYAIFLHGQPEVSGVKLGSAYALKNVRLSSYAIGRYTNVRWDSASALPESTPPVSAAYAFTYSVHSKEVTITGYTGELPTELVLPAEIDGQKVTAIGEEAFSYCSKLRGVTIPKSVTVICNAAFYFCSELTSVTIPEGVTTIGDSAFSDCYCLTSVTISKSVTTIGKYAFQNCMSLKSVTVPGKCKIGEGAFLPDCKVISEGTGSSEEKILRGDSYTFVIAENRWCLSRPLSGQSREFFPVDVDGNGIDELVVLKRGGPMDSGFYWVYGAFPSENRVALIASGDCSADAFVQVNEGIRTLAISEYHTGYEYDILLRIENGVLTGSNTVELDAEAGEGLPGYFRVVGTVNLY